MHAKSEKKVSPDCTLGRPRTKDTYFKHFILKLMWELTTPGECMKSRAENLRHSFRA